MEHDGHNKSKRPTKSASEASAPKKKSSFPAKVIKLENDRDCYNPDPTNTINELPFTGTDTDSVSDDEPVHMDVDSNHNVKYAEPILECEIHTAPGFECKSEKNKWKEEGKKAEMLALAKLACALLNGCGGIIKLNNVNCRTAQGKDLDDYWSGIDKILKRMVEPQDYGKLFDLRGTVDDEVLHLFVKSAKNICFVKGNLFLASDHEVAEASAEQVRQVIAEEHQTKTSRKSKNRISHNLKDLPSIPNKLIHNKPIGLRESKHIQFKECSRAGPGIISRLYEKIHTVISAFANTEGGRLVIGVEDKATLVKGVNCNGSEKEIEAKVDRMIKKMIWGLTPEKGCHWDIRFVPVVGCPDDVHQEHHKVIVISVAGVGGTGGVYVSEPGCYRSRVAEDGRCFADTINLAQLKQLVQKDLKLQEQKLLCEQFELLKVKGPGKNSHVATVRGSCQRIRDAFFKIEKGCPVVPKGFENKLPEGAQRIMKEIHRECEGDMGLIIAARSWSSCLGEGTKEGVICDLLLVNRTKGIFLYTVADRDHDFTQYNIRISRLLKQKLIEAGCQEKFYISCHVIMCGPNPVNINKLKGPEYPTSYSVTSGSERSKYNSILKSLVVVLASYPSLLANRLGLEFLNLLTEQQFEILWRHASELDNSRTLWIEGPAGTGKTNVAVAFMSLLRRREGLQNHNILFICENTGLKKHIEKFNVCQAVCRASFMKGSFSEVKHVVIDEAQNFRSENGPWFSKAQRLVSPHGEPSGYLWVFLDANQGSHSFPTGLPELHLRQPRFRLKKVIRNSKKIFSYSKKFLTDQDRDRPLEIAHDFRGDGVDQFLYSGSCENAVAKIMANLSTEGYNNRSRDVAFLFSRADQADNVRLSLRTSYPQTRFGDVEENDEDCVALTSVRKYSGLERPVVVVVDPQVDKVYHKYEPFMYSAVTRAMVKLIILRKKT